MLSAASYGCSLVLIIGALIRSTNADATTRAYAIAGKVGTQARSPYRGRGVVMKSKGFALHGSGYKANATSVDVASSVLDIDAESRIVHVEAGATMQSVVRATLARGLLPKVVGPFRKMTVGGAIVGSAVSSASHRCGQLHDVCSYIEVALGNGTLVNCSRVSLFRNLTLINALIMTRAGIECEPAGRYVRVSYSRLASPEEGVRRLKSVCHYGPPPPTAAPPAAGHGSPDFVDAVVMGHAGGAKSRSAVGNKPGDDRVLMAQAWYERGGSKGKAPLPKLPLFECHRAWELFYCEHLQDVAKLLDEEAARVLAAAQVAQVAGNHRSSNKAPSAPPLTPSQALSGLSYTERMPTEDYVFRFDRGAFWLAQARGQRSLLSSLWIFPLLAAWLYFLSSRFIFVRLLSRWLLESSTLFAILRAATPDLLASRLVMMNAALPADRTVGLVHFTRNTVPGIKTPLYLLPVRGADTRQPFSPHGHVHTLFIEVGICGRVDDGKGREHTRRLEAFIAAQKGRKHLGTQNFYLPGEFWRGFPLYHPEEYSYLRKKYGAEHVFPDLYSKVCEPSVEQRGGLIKRYLDSRRRKFVGLLL